MPTALVTGGCGFIASNFINRMKDKYPDIVFVTVDKMDYCSNPKNIHEGKAIIVKGNVGNAELIEHLILRLASLAGFKLIVVDSICHHIEGKK